MHPSYSDLPQFSRRSRTAQGDWAARAARLHTELRRQGQIAWRLLVADVALLLDGGLEARGLILARRQLASGLRHLEEEAALLQELTLLDGERTPRHAVSLGY